MLMRLDAMRRSRTAPLAHLRPNWFALLWQNDRFSTNRSVSAVPVQLQDMPLACVVVTAVSDVLFCACVNVSVSVTVLPTVAFIVPSRHSPFVTLVRVSVIVQTPASWRGGGGVGTVGAGGGESFPQAASEKANTKRNSRRLM